MLLFQRRFYAFPILQIFVFIPLKFHLITLRCSLFPVYQKKYPLSIIVCHLCIIGANRLVNYIPIFIINSPVRWNISSPFMSGFTLFARMYQVMIWEIRISSAEPLTQSVCSAMVIRALYLVKEMGLPLKSEIITKGTTQKVSPLRREPPYRRHLATCPVDVVVSHMEPWFLPPPNWGTTLRRSVYLVVLVTNNSPQFRT